MIAAIGTVENPAWPSITWNTVEQCWVVDGPSPFGDHRRLIVETQTPSKYDALLDWTDEAGELFLHGPAKGVAP